MGYTITLGIGIILLGISLVMLNSSIQFIKNESRATATIIEIEKFSDSDETTYKPVFKYFTYANEEIIYNSISQVHILLGPLETKQQ